jgi:hypothetical protein
MRSKKGFLLGEYTLKIILAVLVLVLLFYLLFNLYSFQKDSQNKSDADASLTLITGKLAAAKQTSQPIVLLKPSEWVLLSYAKSESSKPGICKESCLCICEKAGTITGLINNQITKCDKTGSCQNIAGEITMFEPINLPADILLNFESNKYTIKENET